jgi:hypothetical protein
MAAASPIGSLDPPLVMHVLSFLTPRDIVSFAATARRHLPPALDESVWGAVTRRSFPDVPRGFAPPDGLWRAEYKDRMGAAARQVRRAG